ncbi:MAG: FAD-dependent oxidoreductase, partial [Spirochaetota bacterium]
MVRVDIAVIGGGFAGLSSARCIKEADPSLDVALLEAEYIGFGASGRNAGFLLPTPPLAWFAHDPNEPNWKDNVRWAVSYNLQQAQELKALIERERIDCDFRPAPVIIVAPSNLQWNVLKWMADQ